MTTLHEISEIDLNRLAQVFFEHSGELRGIIPLTYKEDIVSGLRGVFDALEVPIGSTSVTETQLLPVFRVRRIDN